MNRIFALTQGWSNLVNGTFNVKHSFVPKQRRHPARMPVIPLRSKKPFRQAEPMGLKAQMTQQLDSVKSINLNWTVMINTGLALMLLAIGVAVVHFSYQNRQQVIELSQLRADRDQLQQDWTYLLRDENQLSEFSRIESTAIIDLKMHRPDKDDIFIMKKS